VGSISSASSKIPAASAFSRTPPSAPEPNFSGNIAAIAARFDARPTGLNKFTGHCTGSLHARGDRNRSLSISAGREGRVLLHCFFGCSLEDILQGAGLKRRDLFSVPPPLPEELKKLTAEREKQEEQRRAMRALHREGRERLRGLQAFLEDLAPRLMFMPDGPEATEFTRIYHATLGEIRYRERGLASLEKVLHETKR
jgi:hypothetical protein